MKEFGSPGGGARVPGAPLRSANALGPNLFHFHAVFSKIVTNNRLVLPREAGVSRLGNPGSDTGLDCPVKGNG